MVLAQLIAQLCQKRIVRDKRQIRYIHTVCMAFASSSANGHVRHIALACPCSHGDFGFFLITGIDHALNIRRHQLQPVSSIHEFFNAMHLACRIDLRNTLTHCLNLGLAQRGFQGMDLSVDVGLGYVVQINQRELTNTTASKGFHRPGTNPSNTCDHHVGCSDAGSSSHSIQTLQSTKSALLQRSVRLCRQALQCRRRDGSDT